MIPSRTPSHASVRRRLRRWITRLFGDLTDLFFRRQIFLEYSDVVRANNAARDPPEFDQWVRRHYAEAAALAVRRIVGQPKDRRSISLVRVLGEVESNRRAFSRSWLRQRAAAREKSSHWGDNLIDRLVGSKARFIPVRWCQSRRRRILRCSQCLRRYVDKSVAHHDRRGVSGRLPTFDDLTSAVDEIDRVLVEVFLLITGDSFRTAFPYPNGNWRKVFMKAWLPEDRSAWPERRLAERRD